MHKLSHLRVRSVLCDPFPTLSPPLLTLQLTMGSRNLPELQSPPQACQVALSCPHGTPAPHPSVVHVSLGVCLSPTGLDPCPLHITAAESRVLWAMLLNGQLEG